MAFSQKVTCDVCGIERGPSNHWILYIIAPAGNIIFSAWDASYRITGHLCGSGCAAKLLSQKIEEWRYNNSAVSGIAAGSAGA